MVGKNTLFIPFVLLLVFAVIELALVSRMVGYLHTQKTNVGSYQVSINGTEFDLHVLPEKLSLNQGHTTNGAAGYGLVLSITCLFGMFWFRKNSAHKQQKTVLLTMTTLLGLLFLFTLSAFVYVFAVTYLTIGNTIDVNVAQDLAGKAYNIDSWTPETWYRALLLLPLQQVDLSGAYHEMVAWRWWILPYLLVTIITFAWTATVYLTEKELEPGFSEAWRAEDERNDKAASPV